MVKYYNGQKEYENGFPDFMTTLMHQQLMKTVEYWTKIFNLNKDYLTDAILVNINLWRSMGGPMMIATMNKMFND